MQQNPWSQLVLTWNIRSRVGERWGSARGSERGSSPAVGVGHEVGPPGDMWQRTRAGQEWLLVKTHQQTLLSFVLTDT